jgi:hypothetical protein
MERAEGPVRRQRQPAPRMPEWALSHAEEYHRGLLPHALLQPEPFLHQPLQAGLVQEIVGEFFVGEHG